jgi:hypothetical protein
MRSRTRQGPPPNWPRLLVLFRWIGWRNRAFLVHPKQAAGNRQEKALADKHTEALQPQFARSERPTPASAALFHGVDHRASRCAKLQTPACMLALCPNQPSIKVAISRDRARHGKL